MERKIHHPEPVQERKKSSPETRAYESQPGAGARSKSVEFTVRCPGERALNFTSRSKSVNIHYQETEQIIKFTTRSRGTELERKTHQPEPEQKHTIHQAEQKHTIRQQERKLSPPRKCHLPWGVPGAVLGGPGVAWGVPGGPEVALEGSWESFWLRFHKNQE